MVDYTSAANSIGMWVVCALIIIVVMVMAARMTIIAIRAGRAIGMSRAQMMAAFRTGVVTALVPSVAIVIGLAVLIPSVGFPISWMRLSVIGSVVYELMAVRAAASQMGLDNISADPQGKAFAVAVWAMSLGVMSYIVFVAFFTPRIDKLKKKIAGRDEGWIRVMTVASFFGAVGYMVAQPVVKGGASLVAVLGGFVAMAALGVVITLGKQKWLREWALGLAIVAGMVAAGVWAGGV